MPEALSPESKPIAPKTADDINEMFKELDNEPEPEPKERKEPKVKEDDDEEPEIKAKEDDDDLELVDTEDEGTEKLDLLKDDDINIQDIPRKKEILKKYPDLFKDFPHMEKMMYRDREYTALFGSFDDAKELAEKAETFTAFENQLMGGNTVELLKDLKENNTKAFDLVVDNYLGNLAKVDKEAYFHVTGNLNKRLIMEMVQEANSTDNDALKEAALLVNQFIFGTSTFSAPTNRVDNKEDPAKKEVEEERLNFVKERFETSRDEMQTRVDNRLRATISEYIDPKGRMSGYVKKNAVADAMKYLTDAIGSDPSVAKNLDKLWRASFEAKFAKDSLGKIESYYLSRAKANLKNAILKARSEALKDATPAKRETEEEVEQPESERTQRRIPTGKPSQPKGKNEMKKGESVTDFFMRD